MSSGIGEWIESEFGTSAGTRLGPLLFIVNVYDVPRCILPKFADDLVAFSVDSSITSIEEDLQHATDELVAWADKEGMELNVTKTKAMLFGNQQVSIRVMMHGSQIDNVDSFKYLGVILDSQLNFSLQSGHAEAKVKRAMAKVSRMICGRQGIPIDIGINLYKTLIRPHMEYALPVWANISDKDLVILENAQTHLSGE